jgi:hypothetical protein
VFGPEEREDRQLEVVRAAPEQLLDTVELTVGEPEGPVELRLGDARQRPENIERI